uniref:Uncharacterized protein n=1 Tax=Leersia perrieri TaxID=77586 RepID=A0A0D9VLA4_9ORYZ
MGRKKAEGASCRRHPRHRQGGAAGVCALCLRERLSHLSTSLPSVVRGEKEDDDYEAPSSCGSDSSSEASSGASSSESSSSAWAVAFHQEMAVSGKLSLLMRHERVLMDGDEVASVVRRMRERRRLQASSFWTKLMHATIGGGGGGGKSGSKEACSIAHSKTMGQERSTNAAKWILF